MTTCEPSASDHEWAAAEFAREGEGCRPDDEGTHPAPSLLEEAEAVAAGLERLGDSLRRDDLPGDAAQVGRAALVIYDLAERIRRLEAASVG